MYKRSSLFVHIVSGEKKVFQTLTLGSRKRAQTGLVFKKLLKKSLRSFSGWRKSKRKSDKIFYIGFCKLSHINLEKYLKINVRMFLMPLVNKSQ
jgi:hypothetical protein